MFDMAPSELPLTIAGRSVLIVEDQVLIALDVEDMVLGLGARTCRIVSSAAEAKSLLLAHRPDFAFLDFSLGDDTCEGVADRLIALDVPFVFFTGYGEDLVLPDRFHGIPIAGKPVTRATLAAKVHLALERMRPAI